MNSQNKQTMSFGNYLSMYVETIHLILNLHMQKIKVKQSQMVDCESASDQEEMPDYTISICSEDIIHDIARNILTLCTFKGKSQLSPLELINNFKDVVTDYPGFMKRRIDSVTNSDYISVIEDLKKEGKLTLRNSLISSFNSIYYIP